MLGNQLLILFDLKLKCYHSLTSSYPFEQTNFTETAELVRLLQSVIPRFTRVFRGYFCNQNFNYETKQARHFVVSNYSVLLRE